MDPSQRPQRVVRAYVLGDGQVVSDTYLDQYATKGNDTKSRQLPPDRFENQYDRHGLVRPLYNLEAMARLLEINTYHMRATKTKAADVSGRGWRLVPREGLEAPSEGQKRRAEDFFRSCSPKLPLLELFKRVIIDYDATGNGVIEVVPSPVDGRPRTLAHIPAHTVRRHVDFERYAQLRGDKIRWFADIAFDKDVNMHNGQVAPMGTIPYEDRASKVIHLMNYSSRSDYYGLPDVLPALGAILGDLYRRDYNVKFFENHAIPAYAVTVVGAELDDDVQHTIEEFFQKKVKGNPHSTLVLTATGGDGRPVEFKFEKLAVEVREASFRLYRQDNRDEVLTAHAVPPYRAGIAEAGSLGQNVARETTEIYKDSVVGPRQQMLAWVINQHILQDGLQVTDWQFEFVELDTSDESQQADVFGKYFRVGAYTPNQIRQERGLDPEDDPAMDAYYVYGRAITGPYAQSAAGGGPQLEALLDSVKALHEQLVAVIKRERDAGH